MFNVIISVASVCVVFIRNTSQHTKQEMTHGRMNTAATKSRFEIISLGIWFPDSFIQTVNGVKLNKLQATDKLICVLLYLVLGNISQRFTDSKAHVGERSIILCSKSWNLCTGMIYLFKATLCYKNDFTFSRKVWWFEKKTCVWDSSTTETFLFGFGDNTCHYSLREPILLLSLLLTS